MSGVSSFIIQGAEFRSWIQRAYRDAFAPGRWFSLANMQVAFEAGRRHARPPEPSAATEAFVDHHMDLEAKLKAKRAAAEQEVRAGLAPPVDNSRCKAASGGAPCVSHCGDPICLGGQVMTKKYDPIPSLRWVRRRREMHTETVLQVGYRPINGGQTDWSDVPVVKEPADQQKPPT